MPGVRGPSVCGEGGQLWEMACSQATFQRQSSPDCRLASPCLRESASTAGSHGRCRSESLGPGGGKPEQPPVSPREVILLFNGKDLSGLSTWLKDTKRDDPRKVFSRRGRPAAHQRRRRRLRRHRESYRDYHLIVEYKWGKRTDGGKYVRNSGILLHATGPDGGAGGTWMSSIECQLAQGCVGDLIPIRGKDEAGADDSGAVHERGRLGPDNRPRWKKGGQVAGLHRRPALVGSTRPGVQGAARHARQGRRREPAGRVDPGRMPLRRATRSRSASTAPRSTSATTCFPRPARSCCSRKDSSCSSASSSCIRLKK